MYELHILIGHVGNDPVMKYTQAGKAVCSFSLAVNHRFGENETTTWYRVSAWEKLAERVNQYVKKGDRVQIEARSLKASTFIGKDGQPQASLEITASNVLFLTPKRESNDASGFGSPEEEMGNIPF